ncbi:hypothetical protein BaRGS_00022672, partial [Batillaria attramentaria]
MTLNGSCQSSEQRGFAEDDVRLNEAGGGHGNGMAEGQVGGRGGECPGVTVTKMCSMSSHEAAFLLKYVARYWSDNGPPNKWLYTAK